MQLASAQWDAVHPGMVPEPLAGPADLAAAAALQDCPIEVRPFFEGLVPGRRIAREAAGSHAHIDSMCVPVYKRMPRRSTGVEQAPGPSA